MPLHSMGSVEKQLGSAGRVAVAIPVSHTIDVAKLLELLGGTAK